MELIPSIFGENDARQIVAGQVVSLESTLRTTLRALAVCAARRSDAHTVNQLVDRARLLADQLNDALEALDDSAASRDARTLAVHLEERLGVLERLAHDRRNTIFS